MGNTNTYLRKEACFVTKINRKILSLAFRLDFIILVAPIYMVKTTIYHDGCVGKPMATLYFIRHLNKQDDVIT